MTKIKVYLESILIPLGLGLLVSLLLKDSFNYEKLVKPSVAPPTILFPIVWTILYALMGISYAILVRNGLNTPKVRKIYYWQLLINLIWPIVFFGLQLRGLALIIIAILVYFVFLMIKIFYHRNQLAGLLQIPYFIWLLFATYLNYQAYILNR